MLQEAMKPILDQAQSAFQDFIQEILFLDEILEFLADMSPDEKKHIGMQKIKTGAVQLAVDLAKSVTKIIQIEAVHPLKALFDVIDSDGDGEIDARELQHILDIFVPAQMADGESLVKALRGIVDRSQTSSLGAEDLAHTAIKIVGLISAVLQAATHIICKLMSKRNLKKITDWLQSVVVDLPAEAIEELPFVVNVLKQILSEGIAIAEVEQTIVDNMGSGSDDY